MADGLSDSQSQGRSARPGSSGPSGSSRAGSTRRCGPSGPSAAPRTSWPGARAPTSGTSTATATSTTSSPTGRRSWATPIPKVVEAVRRAAGRRHVLRGADRAGGAAGRGDLRPGGRGASRSAWSTAAPRRPCRRSGWPGARPAATGRRVRRLLPRPQRRPAGRRGQRGGHPRVCRPRPASPGRRWPTPWSPPTTWCPDIGDDVACVIVEPVAANMGLVPPAPGFLEGLRGGLRPGRRPADLRRGHHRLPLGLGGARRGLRRAAGPVVLRQGHRRRAAPRPPSAAGGT